MRWSITLCGVVIHQGHQLATAVMSNGEEGSSVLPGSLIIWLAGVLLQQAVSIRGSVLAGEVEVLETIGAREEILKYRVKVICPLKLSEAL